MKEVSKCYYVHKSALEQFTLEELKIICEKVKFVPKGFKFDVVKFNWWDGAVSFTSSPDWDTANEPEVGDSYRISVQNGVKFNKAMGQIYHHKWQFVSESYTGFDLEQSKMRSIVVNRISIGVKNRIGYKNFWLNLLANNGVEV